MAMAGFSFSLLCPVKSASRRGRAPTSNCRSSAWRFPETSSRSGMCYQLTVGGTDDRLLSSVNSARLTDHANRWGNQETRDSIRNSRKPKRGLRILSLVFTWFLPNQLQSAPEERFEPERRAADQIGRASCRERVYESV